MKVLKVTLIATIALVMCFSFAACSSTEEAKTSQDGVWQYVEVEGGISLTAINSIHETGLVVVPEYVDGQKVVSLGEKLFVGIDDGSSKKSDKGVYRENTVLDTVIIEAKVKEIPNMCFYYCTALRNVILPSTCEKIAPFSFFNCASLTKIELPEATVSIGEYAFRQCKSLREVVINNNSDDCITIGDKAFYNLNEKVSKDEQYYIDSDLTIFVKNLELYDVDVLESKRVATKNLSYKYWKEYVEAGVVHQK